MRSAFTSKKKSILFLCHLLLWVCSIAHSQDKPSLYVDAALWAGLETELQQVHPPGTYSFIPQLVKKQFGNQPDSLYRNYYAVMIRLERLFNLPAAIYVGKEMAVVANEAGNQRQAAAAYTNISRYYDALGAYQLATASIEKALSIYKSLNNDDAALRAEYARLTLRLRFGNPNDIIPLLESVLDLAITHNAEHIINLIHVQLMEQQLLAKNYEEAQNHVVHLEKFIASAPLNLPQYSFLINTSITRAELSLAANNFTEAERYYQQTLRYCEAEPSRWVEVYVLHALTELELTRGNRTLAKSYLEKAQRKAETLRLHDLLIRTYELKSKIAEQENNPANALLFLKKKLIHQAKFNQRSEGFNLETYYLQAERDKLAADKKSHELEMSLKQSQLTYLSVIILLVGMLAVVSAIGYMQQSRRKAELTRQNNLIQHQTNQLKTLDAAKSRFFANVSHELRTPLSLIAGPVSTLLKDDHQTEKQTTLLRTVSRSVNQLELMVNDLLDLRKLEVGKMAINTEPTSLRSFFEIHLGQFESLAGWKQLHYEQRVEIDPALIVNLDREKCRQILYNLLANAFKFTPANGQVRVAVCVQTGRLFIDIADTGRGIHADDLPLVFKRFFQTSRTGHSPVGGTGIGLSICHDYAHLMNGAIGVESKLGEGSVFHVSWPVAAVETNHIPVAPLHVQAMDELHDVPISVEHTTPGKTSPITSVTGSTILVVEDNPGLRDYLRMVLSDQYRVITGPNHFLRHQGYLLNVTPATPAERNNVVYRQDASWLFEPIK